MVEFAPEWLKRMLEPVVRLLASVPSVIYGLIGVTRARAVHRQPPDQPARQGIGHAGDPAQRLQPARGVVILTVMIAPIMIAIFAEGLRSVPRGWLEGSLALGRQPLADVLEASAVRAARPALIAGTVLATARALGESVMLEHGLGLGRVRAQPRRRADLLLRAVTRARADDPRRTPTQLSSPPMKHTLFAIAAVLLFSSAMLSLGGWAAKQPMKRYFNLGGAGRMSATVAAKAPDRAVPARRPSPAPPGA